VHIPSQQRVPTGVATEAHIDGAFNDVLGLPAVGVVVLRARVIGCVEILVLFDGEAISHGVEDGLGVGSIGRLGKVFYDFSFF